MSQSTLERYSDDYGVTIAKLTMARRGTLTLVGLIRKASLEADRNFYIFCMNCNDCGIVFTTLWAFCAWACIGHTYILPNLSVDSIQNCYMQC